MSEEPCPQLPEYSASSSLLDNLPFAAMLLMGAAILKLSIGASPAGWLVAVGYVVVGLLGVLGIMVLLCPFCPSYGKRSCPCGYGVIAARLRKAGDPTLFTRKFPRVILLVVPLWFIPPAFAVSALVRSLHWPLVSLLAGFVVVGFVIIPLLSHQHGCKLCPQREACPWARGK